MVVNNKWHANLKIAPTNKGRNNLHPKIAGILIYCESSVDSTILVYFGSIYNNQANRHLKISQAIKQLLDYCAAHPDATICYN